MKIRDRIKELRRVPASELLPDPRNWRKHPQAQQDAMRGVLSEIGYADAVLARETPNGLMLIDGHLRAETTPDAMVPVLVLDVDEVEAGKILATHDPLAAMAEADSAKLDELLREVDTGSEALQAMLAEMAEDAGLIESDEIEVSAVAEGNLTKMTLYFTDDDHASVVAAIEKQKLGKSYDPPQVDAQALADVCRRLL